MRIEETLRSHLRSFGYQLVDTPIVEPARLYLTKAGDQVLDRLFVVMHGGHEYVLRPEFTASAADKFCREIGKGVVRWQFSGPVFQDIPGDSERRFQKQSLGAELIGLESIYADAEIIAVALLGLDTIGVGGAKVSIGHVGLTQHLLKKFQLDKRALRFVLGKRSLLTNINGKEAFTEVLDHFLPNTTAAYNQIDLDNPRSAQSAEYMLNALLNSTEHGVTLGGRTREEIALRLLEKQEMVSQRTQILEAVDFLAEWIAIDDDPDEAFARIETFISDDVGHNMLDRWKQQIQLVRAFDLDKSRISIRPDLARTWDYYTGIVFEILADDPSGKVLHIGGGGRYDELTRLIGANSETPAVGFSYDMDLVAELIDNQETREPIYISVESDFASAIHWANKLRYEGIAVQIVDNNSDSKALTILDNGNVGFRDRLYRLDDFQQLLETLRK